MVKQIIVLLSNAIVYLFVSNNICFAQNELQQGIDWYELRAENHKGLKVDSININKAIAYFQSTLQSKSDNKKAYAYLMKSYYYKAAFVVSSKSDQKALYLKGKQTGDIALKTYPNDKEILFWYIANFGKYGEANGIMASAKEGLADKMKKSAEKLLAIDSIYADGAAHKILGVMNYKAPYIPLILTWPSKKKAEYHLKQALKVNPKSISNLYYYAEFLIEVNRNEEAKLILERAIKIAPNPSNLIEEMYDIKSSTKLLEKLNQK